MQYVYLKVVNPFGFVMKKGKVYGISIQFKGVLNEKGSIRLRKALSYSTTAVVLPGGLDEVNADNMMDIFMHSYNDKLLKQKNRNGRLRRVFQ